MRLPTSVKLLDQLLEGGLPQRSTTLLYGPSFLGREDLARQVVVSALHNGVPAIVVTTTATPSEVKADLEALEPAIGSLEREGLLWFIDVYGPTIGADSGGEHVEVVDSPTDLNGISLAVNRVQAAILPDHEHHLLLVDSASTLVVHNSAATVFRFLQILTGKAKRAGAASLLLLDQGMHSEADVQMFRHLASGVISVRGDPGKQQMLIEGLGVRKNPGWVEYRVQDGVVEMTGSLAGGRIR